MISSAHRTLGRTLVAVACGVLLGSCTPPQVRYESVAVPDLSDEAVEATLYLVGDGGEVNPNRAAVLSHLSRNIESVARDGAGPPVVVAFLGDNVYDEGATVAHTDEDVEKLRGQVRALGASPNVQGVFLPGNHDWGNGAPLIDGRTAIARQREWLDGMAEGRNIRFMPDDACPGPAALDVGQSIHLLFIDTEWLLRGPSDACGSAEDFYRRLESDLMENRDRRVVVMSHHPLASGGPHAGNVAPFQRGPLVYYLAVKAGVSIQDLASGRYSDMVGRLEEAFQASGAPPMIHAAGHDHTLQVLRLSGPGRPRYQLVSGAASKTANARRVSGTRYATNGFGYMRLDFHAADARLTVYARQVTGGRVRRVFTCSLSQSAPAHECPEAPLLAEGS